jgi:hypothetical protein
MECYELAKRVLTDYGCTLCKLGSWFQYIESGKRKKKAIQKQGASKLGLAFKPQCPKKRCTVCSHQLQEITLEKWLSLMSGIREVEWRINPNYWGKCRDRITVEAHNGIGRTKLGKKPENDSD